MGALPGERRVLEHHSTPDPAEPTGLLRTRVVGAGGALAGPGTEHRQRLQDFFQFGRRRLSSRGASITLHGNGRAAATLLLVSLSKRRPSCSAAWRRGSSPPHQHSPAISRDGASTQHGGNWWVSVLPTGSVRHRQRSVSTAEWWCGATSGHSGSTSSPSGA